MFASTIFQRILFPLITIIMALAMFMPTIEAAEVRIIEKRNYWDIDHEASVVDPVSNMIEEQPPRCNVRLKGEIKKGDLSKIRKAFRQVKHGNLVAPAFLCLDSPGGSYQEGLNIAKFLLGDSGNGISTVIERGAKCLSSCALIFMAGNNAETKYAFLPGRWLHVRGQLGFHAPYIKKSGLPTLDYSREDVLKFFRSAQKGIQHLIKVFSVRAHYGGDDRWVGRPWVRPSLFHELLAMGPDEIFFIDTIDNMPLHLSPVTLLCHCFPKENRHDTGPYRSTLA